MIQILVALKTFLKKNIWRFIFLAGLFFLCTIIFSFWLRANQAEDQTRRAAALNTEQFRQNQELRAKLQISQANTEELQAAYDELKSRPPVTSFGVQASTLEVAAEQVTERIDKKDETLPPAALEQTDRTAVVSNNEEFKVDVLKINLDKSWEISTGLGSHQGDIYFPVGIQRNYAKNKGVALEAHLKPDALARGKRKTSGWEARHVWRY